MKRLPSLAVLPGGQGAEASLAIDTSPTPVP